MFAERIRSYAKFGACLTGSDADQALRCAEIVRDFIANRWGNFFRKHANDCLLFYYSSDSTPVITRKRVCSGITIWQVVRKPKVANHFLIEKAFAAAGSEVAYFMTEPTAIHDTCADTHLA
eukprot:882038-Pyramimonas_sp.AAC.1